MNRVKIDVSKIPRIEMRILSSTLVEAVKRFYDDPENQAAFERWMALRKQQEEG